MPDGAITRVTLLGRDWTVARIDGRVVALPDACPHRGSPLSAGCVVDGTVRCAYHGFRFDGQGRCVLIPHRWVVEHDGPVRLFRVVSRPVAV